MHMARVHPIMVNEPVMEKPMADHTMTFCHPFVVSLSRSKPIEMRTALIVMAYASVRVNNVWYGD